MNYKKISIWIAIIGLAGGVIAYGRTRDMDLRTVEVKQEQYDKNQINFERKIDWIIDFLIKHGTKQEDEK